MYVVYLSVRAEKFLSKCDKAIQTRIRERLTRLSEQPIPSDAKFIHRENHIKIFRYRIGDFRALYGVDDNKKEVSIAKIEKRPRVYQ